MYLHMHTSQIAVTDSVLILRKLDHFNSPMLTWHKDRVKRPDTLRYVKPQITIEKYLKTMQYSPRIGDKTTTPWVRLSIMNHVTVRVEITSKQLILFLNPLGLMKNYHFEMNTNTRLLYYYFFIDPVSYKCFLRVYVQEMEKLK